jgi:hypothetical protein
MTLFTPTIKPSSLPAVDTHPIVPMEESKHFLHISREITEGFSTLSQQKITLLRFLKHYLPLEGKGLAADC